MKEKLLAVTSKVTKKLDAVTGPARIRIQKHAPEITFAMGVAGFVGTIVLVSKANTKAEEILDEFEERKAKNEIMLDKVHNGDVSEDVYSEADYAKDTRLVYAQTGLRLVRTYAPAVICGCLTIGCFAGSNYILKGREMGAIAMYNAAMQAYEAQTRRIAEEFGEEKAQEINSGYKVTEIVEKKKNEDGKTETVKTKKIAPHPQGDQMLYARFFDEGSRWWNHVPEYNLMFLERIQRDLNDLLKVRGHVFLNELYDALDIPRSQVGALCGWVLNPEEGDNFIDLGIYRGDEASRAFVNGYEGAILIKPNVQGRIYDLI